MVMQEGSELYVEDAWLNTKLNLNVFYASLMSDVYVQKSHV